MSMIGVVSFAMLLAAQSAPASDCRPACESETSATDRQTCLLQCGQNDTSSDNGTTTWRREERLGGAPPGSKHEGESGTTTTRETTNADGTTIETTTTTKRGTTVQRTTTPPPGSSPSAATSPTVRASVPSNMSAAGPWIVLAQCQTRCDGDVQAKPRASCKLRCLDASPALVRRRVAKRVPNGAR